MRLTGTTARRVPITGPPDGELFGVAATSARNAWAVGFSGSNKTVILHWNGLSWKRVPNPSHSQLGDDSLTAVSAASADNAWAVGVSASGGVALHWNGRSWKQVTTPPSTFLAGISFIRHPATHLRSAVPSGQH